MDRRQALNRILCAPFVFNAISCKNADLVEPSCEIKNISDLVQPEIIINNDGGDAFTKHSPKSIEEFINLRLSDMVEYGDIVSYCTGTTHIFTHQTKLAQRIENDFLKICDGLNTDPFKIASEYVTSKGKKIFFSLRMNDTHDHIHTHLLSNWKKRNPSKLIGHSSVSYPYGANRWSALNYEIEENRNYIFKIIEEVVHQYEVDGIELDFMRHPIFFPNQLHGQTANEDQRDLLTSLIERIRGLLQENDIMLSIRVPDSIEYSLEIGIDLIKWLDLGLIDNITFSGYFHLNKWCTLGYLKEKYDVKLFACLSRSRLQINKEVLESYFWSNECSHAVLSDFDGIQLFNVFDRYSEFYSTFNLSELQNRHDENYKEQKGYYASHWLHNGKRHYNY